MLHLLFISPKYPINATEARGRVIDNYLRSLYYDYGVRTTLVCISNDVCEPDKKPQYIDQLIIERQPGTISQLFNILINAVILRKAPMQCYLFWSKRLHKKLKVLIKRSEPDVVMCELIRTALFVSSDNNALKILDLADLFSIRYKQQQAKAGQINQVMGQYRAGLLGRIHGVLQSSLIKRFVLGLEAKLVEKMELAVTGRFDVITLVSPREVEQLRATSGRENVEWVPNGTNPPAKQVKISYAKRKNIISFVGVMNVPHNEEAVVYFADSILELIRARVPDVEFHIIGKNPPPAVQALSSRPGIVVSGFVPDIEESIAHSKVFVAPMLSGSGVQTKLFEAMKYGIPMVSTMLAARGIVDYEQSGIVVAEIPEEFAAACCEILTFDELQWNRLGTMGMHHVAQYYYWDVVGKALYETIVRYQQKAKVV